MKQSSLFALVLLAWALPFPAAAQSLDEPVEYILGNLNLSLDTDVLKDGSRIDFSAGYRYAPSAEGAIRLRYVQESYNDDMYDLDDSLVANDELTFEAFLLPLRYHFFNDATLSFNVAAGLYYDYNTLSQHGYFNHPDIGLNSQRNEFSMHILGPLAETGLRFRIQGVDVKLEAGIAPVFYLRRDQSVQIKPYMGSDFFDYSQDTSGSPYVYGELNGIFLRFFSLSLLYEFARINYDVISIERDGDTNAWATPEEELISRSFKLEATILLSLGGGLYLQAGYGHSFDAIELNSSTPVEENTPYLIIGTRKIAF
jgi:hypothetical protein